MDQPIGRDGAAVVLAGADGGEEDIGCDWCGLERIELIAVAEAAGCARAPAIRLARGGNATCVLEPRADDREGEPTANRRRRELIGRRAIAETAARPDATSVLVDSCVVLSALILSYAV
jgi:hypothetical protein